MPSPRKKRLVQQLSDTEPEPQEEPVEEPINENEEIKEEWIVGNETLEAEDYFTWERLFKGDTCISSTGELLEPETSEETETTEENNNNEKSGKKLHVKTFTLSTRSGQYILVLDLARHFGSADSFRFQKLHPNLPRIVVSEEERDELITRGVVHPIMRFRNVPVVSVVCAYLMFGMKLFAAPAKNTSANNNSSNNNNGSTSANNNGNGVEDDLGDDEDEFVTEQLNRLHQMKQARLQKCPVFSTASHSSQNADMHVDDDSRGVETAAGGNVNWMLEVAKDVQRYNIDLSVDRQDRIFGKERVLLDKRSGVVSAYSPARQLQANNNNNQLQQQQGGGGERVTLSGRRAQLKRKSFKEDSEDDSFDEEESSDSGTNQQQDEEQTQENQNSEDVEEQEVVIVRDRPGVFDVHTNMYHVPVDSQPLNVRAKFIRPMSFNDLLSLRKVNENHAEVEKSEDLVDKIQFFPSPTMQPSESNTAGSGNGNGGGYETYSKASLAYWLGPKRFSAPRDAKRYPLALTAGQRQCMRPLVAGRFRASETSK